MATVQLVDGRIFEGVRLTNVQRVGDEGGKRATAHIEDKTYPVYKNDVDGFTEVWQEQMDIETWRRLKGSKTVVEGSLSEE